VCVCVCVCPCVPKSATYQFSVNSKIAMDTAEDMSLVKFLHLFAVCFSSCAHQIALTAWALLVGIRTR